MKTILLPGMDGTGLLFNRLQPLLTQSHQIIALPQGANQTYEYLADYIATQLPRDNFILLAESFSGPLAARIAQSGHPGLKGLIFIATFLTPPAPGLLFLAQKVPLKTIAKSPLLKPIIQRLLIGKNYPIELFFTALEELSESALKTRLASIKKLKTPDYSAQIEAPCLILSAQYDYLAPLKHQQELADLFPNNTHFILPGTHFLAQSNPAGCAEKINAFVAEITKPTTKPTTP